MRTLDEVMALHIVQSATDAWSNGDIERVLSHYTEDCAYWCNAERDTGAPFFLNGKPAFRSFLSTLHSTLESKAVIEHFQLVDGKARAQIAGYVRHRQTGHVLSGTYRNVISFSGNRIARLEEYVDAATWVTFWKLVTSEGVAETQLNS